MRLPRLYTGERRKTFGLLLGNGMAQGALAVGAAALVMQVFDRLAATRDVPSLLFVALLLAVLLSAMLRRQERVHAERVGQHYVSAVRRRLFSLLLNSNSRTVRSRRKGGLLLKFVGDLSALRRWIGLGFARLLVAGVAIATAMAALAWVHWPFAAGVGAMLVSAGCWILWRGKALRAAIAVTRRRQAELSSNVTEKLTNLATVQAFGQARRERRHLRRQSDRLLQASVHKAQHIGSLRAVIDATAGGSVVAVLATAYVLPPSDLSPGMVAALISIIGFLTPPLRDLGRAQEYWLAAQVARENLRKIPQRSSRLRSRRGAAPLAVRQGQVRLESVTVRGALRAVDAEAAGGARVALFGPNGSGKSTLLALLGRLFDPDSGRILIDGQDIARVQLASLRRQIAFVSSDLALVRGSLQKNLCYGTGAVDGEHLRQVLAACVLDDLVARLPNGLRTRITEGGANLSQGERVRVALARALLMSPRVLLLDEVDANLDRRAIEALGNVVRDFSGTLVMVTHRRAALALCDTFWALRSGRLVQLGRPVVAAEGARHVVPLEGDCTIPASTGAASGSRRARGEEGADRHG